MGDGTIFERWAGVRLQGRGRGRGGRRRTGKGERFCSSLGPFFRLYGGVIIGAGSALPWLVNCSNGNQLLNFELRNLLLERCVLRAQPLIFILVSSCDVLQCHATFHLSLLVDLDASLEFGELGLLSFSESSLSGPVNVVSGFFVRNRLLACEGYMFFFFVNGRLPVVIFARIWITLPHTLSH